MGLFSSSKSSTTQYTDAGTAGVQTQDEVDGSIVLADGNVWLNENRSIHQHDHSRTDNSVSNVDNSDNSVSNVDNSNNSVTQIDRSDHSVTQIDNSVRSDFGAVEASLAFASDIGAGYQALAAQTMADFVEGHQAALAVTARTAEEFGDLSMGVVDDISGYSIAILDGQRDLTEAALASNNDLVTATVEQIAASAQSETERGLDSVIDLARVALIGFSVVALGVAGVAAMRR